MVLADTNPSQDLTDDDKDKDDTTNLGDDAHAY